MGRMLNSSFKAEFVESVVGGVYSSLGSHWAKAIVVLAVTTKRQAQMPNSNLQKTCGFKSYSTFLCFLLVLSWPKY